MQIRTLERTQVYFDWAAIRDSHYSREEVLVNGALVQILTRLVGDGVIQLFVGVYTSEGKPIFEDFTSDVQNMTMDQAIAWGLDRGRSVGNGQRPMP